MIGLRTDRGGIAVLPLVLLIVAIPALLFGLVAPEFAWVSVLMLVGLVALYAISRVHHHAAILAFIIFVVIALASTWVFLFAIGGANTNTQSYKNGGWEGSGSYNPNGEGFGELIVQKQIVTAIAADKDSELIAFGGRVRDTGELFSVSCYIDAREYRTFINEKPYKTFPVTTPLTQTFGWFDYTPEQLKLRGIYPAGSVFRVELWTKCAFLNNPYYMVASDEVNLVSGIGQVNWNKDLYTVGQEACANWKVPYTSSEIDGKGWYLVAYHKGTSKTLLDKYEVPSITGQKCIPITSAEFQTSGDCQNIIVVELWSELYQQHWDDAGVVDISANAPTVHLKTDKAEYSEGDIVHVTWNATPNPTTNSPIAKIILRIGTSSPVEYDVSGQTAYDYTTDSDLGVTRTTRISITAQDSGCRPAHADVDVVVHAKGETISPGGIPVLFWVILVIGLLLMFTLPLLPLPVSPKTKVIVGILIGALVILAGAVLTRVIQ